MPVLRLRVVVTLAACGAALLLTQAGSSAMAGETCFGVPATIVWHGVEPIEGTPGNDVIVGGTGDDTIHGNGGNDLICGGTGSDELYGDAGNDRLDGGPDSPPESKITNSNDFYGGPGNDEFQGPGSDDWAWYNHATQAVHVDLAAEVATGEGTDRLVGIDTVEGSVFSDTILGDEHDNYFFPGGGNDTLDGRGGFDSLFFSGISPVTVDVGAGKATGQGDKSFTGMEAYVGSHYADHIYGGPGPDLIAGSGGADVLDGRGGNDVVAGELPGQDDPGNDVVRGGPGNDVLLGVGDDDTIDGGSGAQDLAAYWFARRVHADLGKRRVVGEGIDRLRNVEGIIGSPGKDTLIGNNGPNMLFGDEGRDVLKGLGGDDFLDGGGGLDRLSGGKGADYCLEGERKASCEIAGGSPFAPAATSFRLAAKLREQANNGSEIDYGEKPTCTSSGRGAGLGHAADRRRRRTTAAPPNRLIVVHRRGGRFAAGLLQGLFSGRARSNRSVADADLTWQPVLYRFKGGRWKPYKTLPALHGLIDPATGAAVWSNDAGASVARETATVGAGRYAWAGVTRLGGDVLDATAIEPHLNAGGKGGRFQQFCRFS